MRTRRQVLFLCTGNSCRSQMAEALANSRFPKWRAYSAGVRPAEFVHPMVVRVLGELGIAHQGTPKPVESFRGRSFDLVVTVCDDANAECPVWLGEGARQHVSFRDPATAEGAEAERLAVFRLVRDEIAAALPGLLG